MGNTQVPRCCAAGSVNQASSIDDHGEVGAAPEDFVTAEPSSPEATVEGDAVAVTNEQGAGDAVASGSPLTGEEIQLVESTWEKAAALGAETVGVLLFRNIFELAPEALQLFPFKDEADPYESAKLKTHATGVVTTVGTAVAGLWDLDALVPVLQDLGKRHVGYGVLQPHYDVVGQALMLTLKAGLGEVFTAEAEAAWGKVWSLVATTMIGQNYEARPAEEEEQKGPLSSSELDLVEATWTQAAALGAETVGVLLFRKIFELAPEALQLFPFKDEADPYESAKLKTHATGVVTAVGTAVAGLRDLDALVPVLQDLGKRHVGYGVLQPHYDVVGQALMLTLKAGLGEALTAAAEAAWGKVWSLVAATMIGKNYEAEPAGAEAAPTAPSGADAGEGKHAEAPVSKPKTSATAKKKAPADAKKKAASGTKKKETTAEMHSGDADKAKDAVALQPAPAAAPEAALQVDSKQAEFVAAVEKGDDGAVRKLLKAGASAVAADADGFTPLHISAKNGHDEVTGRLVMQKGVKFDAKTTKEKDTPLHLACRANHRDVAVIIVRAGAKVSIKNGAGKTPREEAKDQLAIWLGNSDPKGTKPPWQ